MDKQLQALQYNLEAAEQCASDQFRGITKLIGSGSRLKCEVDHARGFSTRSVENPLESLTIDPISQFAPTSHLHREDINHGSHS